MRHTREILHQKLTLGRSHRAIAQSLGLSSGTVGATVLRARAAGLDWPQVEALTDDALEGRLYGLRAVAGSRSRPWPDCAALHAERRKPGVTLELLHLEYLEQHPDGYNCWDNAVAESFFATVKVELVHDAAWATRAAARVELVEYLEVFYNGQRRHSALGYLSPRAFERQREHEALAT
jgi:hypothetical protein